MTQVKLDAGLLEQLGMTTWRSNASFAMENHDDLSMQTKENVSDMDESEVDSNALSVPLLKSTTAQSIVFLGSGLDRVWQNEALSEWELFQNILQSVSVEQDRVLYFDSANIQTEDAVFMTLEEIIESGVEYVFSFDSESLLNEHLSEGLAVIELPSLFQMLSSAQAKKSCYYLLTQYVDAV